MNHRKTAYGLLRVTTGVLSLFYGVGKLWRIDRLWWWRESAVCSKAAGLVISALLLIGLTFKTVMSGDVPNVAHKLQSELVNFVLLWFVDLNRYSLDAIYSP